MCFGMFVCVYLYPSSHLFCFLYVVNRADHLKSHMQEHDTNKVYQCPVCQTSYSSMASLTVHLISHQDMDSPSTVPQGTTDSYPCLHCGQSFSQARHLQEHVLIHMSNIKVIIRLCYLQKDLLHDVFT